jgi:hypothetical protein
VTRPGVPTRPPPPGIIAGGGCPQR